MPLNLPLSYFRSVFTPEDKIFLSFFSLHGNKQTNKQTILVLRAGDDENQRKEVLLLYECTCCNKTQYNQSIVFVNIHIYSI